MAVSTLVWIVIILAIAAYAAVVIGNYVDEHLLDLQARRWPPGAAKFWWRRVRFRCQNCGGPLKRSIHSTIPVNGREYRICAWCVKLATSYGQRHGR